MKTALQELIERLEKEAKATKNPAIEIGILRSFKIATELLEKEREIAQEYAKQSKQDDVNDNPHLGYKTALVPDELLKPQPQEKVDVEKILHQVYDAGVRNVDCDLTTHYEQIKNTLQDTKIREAAEEWNKYKSFLQEKYPVEEGEEWQFTCEQHQKIDEILNSKKH